MPHPDDAAALRSAAADILRCATPAGRAAVGCLAVEGLRVVERAVRAGRPPTVAIVGHPMPRAGNPREEALLAELEKAGTRLLPATPDEVLRLMGGRGGGSIVALVPLPALVEPDEILRRSPGAVFLVLAGVEDPGNVGALARTALAGGADALAVLPPGDPFHPKAVRTSMGAVLKLPVVGGPVGDDPLGALRRAGVHLVGAVSEGGTPLPAARFPRPVGLVMGGESFGLPAGLGERLDARVTIPMSGRADSFSVNAAAAVLLYELFRPGS